MDPETMTNGLLRVLTQRLLWSAARTVASGQPQRVGIKLEPDACEQPLIQRAVEAEVGIAKTRNIVAEA